MSKTILEAFTATQLRHTENCAKRVRQEINNHGGSIGFDQFMQIVLHDPLVGYYSQQHEIFGKDGD